MSKKSRHYHHGDLKQALIMQSIARLSDQSIDSLSLRKLSADVGVNHTAAYAHFPTKDALVAAILTWGYEQLSERLDDAIDMRSNRVEQLVQASLVYHRFSVENPNLFAAMVGPRINADNAFPGLEMTLARAYRFIEAPFDGLDSELSLDIATPPVFWASLQGLLSQILAGRVRVAPRQQADLIERFTRAACRGFGLLPEN